MFMLYVYCMIMHCVVVLQERNIYAWSTKTWKKETLLIAESKYAGRPLVSGMLAVSAGTQDHVIYYSPMGKKTIRTIHIHPRTRTDDTKKDMYKAGFKLKTENKKVLVGLASDVIEPNKVYVLTVDGEVMACRVAEGTLAPIASIEGIPFIATQERVKLHTMIRVEGNRNSCLVIIEAERSGITILESIGNNMRIIDNLKTGTGGVISGFGLIKNSSFAVAAVCQARGNMGFFAWKVSSCPDGNLVFQPCNPTPGSLWAALDGNQRGSQSSLEMNSRSMVSGAVLHSRSGMMAFWAAPSDNVVGSSHLRIPLVHVVSDEGLEVPFGLPLHSSPYFWMQGSSKSHDGVVSQLKFPCYTYLNNQDMVMSLDITHDTMTASIRPNLNLDKKNRTLVRTVHSSKKGAWLLFSQLNSGEHAGSFQFTALTDRDATVSAGSWWFPGRDGTFVGSRDELTVVLSNSGKTLTVFDTQKLATQGVKGMIGNLSGFEDGPILRVFKGPISRIPSPPRPKPDINTDNDETDEEEEEALQEWEAYEAKRHDVPKVLMALTYRNKFCLLETSQVGSVYQHNAKSVKAKLAYQLPSHSAVIQVAWQSLLDPEGDFHSGMEGSDTAVACIVAVLLSDRVIVLSDTLEQIFSALMPEDAGSPVSFLWVGPSLLVSTSSNQIIYINMDGTVNHGCSTLMAPPLKLLAATADRLVYAYNIGTSNGVVEASHRSWDPVPMMLLGWAHLYAASILPGGYARANQSLKSLLSSYGATRIPVSILEGLTKLGFAELSAAAARCSELSSMTENRRGIFQAAAGDWDPIVTHLLTEYEESEFFPDHPEESSPIYKKLVTLARSCEFYGHFKHARNLFEAAGAWRELFSLCIFQGDFDGLQRYASRGGRQSELLANHLLAVNEDAFRRSVSSCQPKFSGRPFVDDYLPDAKQVPSAPREVEGLESPVLSTEEYPSHLELAPADRMPFMESTLEVTDDSVLTGKIFIENLTSSDTESEDGPKNGNPIGRLDRTKLMSYIGIAGATIKPGHVISHEDEEQEMEELVDDDLHDVDFDDEDDSALGAVQRVITAGPGSDSATETSKSESVGGKEAAKIHKQQEEARAAFFASQKLIDDEFYSSDDDSSTMGMESAASFAATTTSKLIFKIKSKEDMELSESNTESLKNAVQNLTLTDSVTKSDFRKLSGTPSRDTFSEKSVPFESTSQPVQDSFAQLPSLPVSGLDPEASRALPEELFVPMKPQPVMKEVVQSDLLAGWNEFEALFASPNKETEEQTSSAVEASTSLIDVHGGPNISNVEPSSVPSKATENYNNAKSYFASNSWHKAAREFGKAFTSGTSGDPGNDNFRRQCANEYAASVLMHKASKSKSATAARLSRHASALDLDMSMQLICQVNAAENNIKAGNFEWSRGLLSTIVVEINEGIIPNDIIDHNKIQKMLTTCEGKDANKSLPADEDVNAVRMIIEVSQTLQELDDTISELL